MSTAEAVNVALSGALRAIYMGDGRLRAEDIASQMWGVAVKDNLEDRRKIRHYLNTIGQERARKNKQWKAFLKAARALE